jgi:hypothetical protein
MAWPEYRAAIDLTLDTDQVYPGGDQVDPGKLPDNNPPRTRISLLQTTVSGRPTEPIAQQPFIIHNPPQAGNYVDFQFTGKLISMSKV